MARGNRRENRAAAKAMLEVPGEDKTEVKKIEEDQKDFFAAAEVDDLGDEDDDNAQQDREEEVDEENKTSSAAPNVESDEEEVDDDVKVEEIDEDDDTKGEEVDKKIVEPSTEGGKSETKEAAKDGDKPAEPASKEDEKKEEEKKETPAAPVPEGPKELSNEEASKLYGEWRSQTEELLATHHYRLDEKMVEELNANPAAFIPKMMSKVYMDSISAAFQQFTQYLPRMVGQVIQQRETMNASEKMFFDKWPDLVNHRDTVLRLGQSYRTSNPAATVDDFVNEVGAQAMVALRLTPNGAAPPVTNGKAETKPFKPATNAPGGAPSSPKKSDNPFEQLAGEFEFEEEIGED